MGRSNNLGGTRSKNGIYHSLVRYIEDVFTLLGIDQNSLRQSLSDPTTTGGLRIVRILCSQGIVLLRNRTKRGLVLSMQNVLLKAVFQEKMTKNCTISGNLYYTGDRTM